MCVCVYIYKITFYMDPGPAPFVCLPFLTHLILLISSLVETARTKLGVSDKRDTKCAGQGFLQDSFGNHCFRKECMFILQRFWFNSMLYAILFCKKKNHNPLFIYLFSQLFSLSDFCVSTK